ncbi:hypothetical protein ACI8AV_13045 [Geodermatophilus sp. SYSU D00804]
MSYLGTQLPPGVQIEVGTPVVTDEAFTVKEDGCSNTGGPPCEGFVFTSGNTDPNDRETCIVAVHYDVPVADEPAEPAPEPDSALLRLSGRLQCPADLDPPCTALATSIETDDQDIALSPPEQSG